MFQTLIVDDRDIFLTELKKLKIWGEASGFWIADKANNGKQALDLLRAKSYDLVLTDIRMPVVDGLQLLREIKKENLCSCVVFLSEFCEFHYAREGIVLGAFDYLVKPATEESLADLLKRASSFLLSRPSGSRSTDSFVDENFDRLYPFTEEASIVNQLSENDPMTILSFKTTLDNLYILLEDNIIKADIIIKKLYHNIIKNIYEKFPWLKQYINPVFFNEIDFLRDGDDNAYKSLYCRKLDYLANVLKKLHPITSDPNLRDICEYLLSNPEKDLKLKLISEQFFLNNTYLSSTFSTKLGIRYNDFVTLIKMTHAEYLIRSENLKPYEVGYQLGYKDINYFLKQFKAIHGQSAAKFRNSEYIDYQI